MDFLNGRVALHHGNCLEVLATLPENSIDACVTDPPYHLLSTVERFAKKTGGADRTIPVKDHQYQRLSKGFMGKSWDGGDVAFRPLTWKLVMRTLKPGAHLVAFGAAKNGHRLACAIEDAGFEIREGVFWLFGTGFPKSHDMALAFEKTLCERRAGEWHYLSDGEPMVRGQWRHPEALQWDGWGTALKPSVEPIVLARKPITEASVAANVHRWGTGALNIDAARIHTEGSEGKPYTGKRLKPGATLNETGGNWRPEAGDAVEYRGATKDGRWPANLIHDGSEEVVAAFPDSAGQQGDVRGTEPSSVTAGIYGKFNGRVAQVARDDGGGSAARFFYSAKADAGDRIGSKHPTVKPVDLMRYLCRLIVPPGGMVLDPFAGTGTTGEAAFLEGFRATLIEREAEYVSDIERRMRLVLAGPVERSNESVKARAAPIDDGPLFGGQ